MSALHLLIETWPYLIMLGIIGGLVILRTRRTRGALPVPVPVLTENMEMTVLAEVTRAGIFYVCGVAADWELCCEFATKIVGSASPDDVNTPTSG